MDSDVKQDEGDSDFHSFQENGSKNKSSGNYVMGCAIFASLNSVLLGYGWCISYSFCIHQCLNDLHFGWI